MPTAQAAAPPETTECCTHCGEPAPAAVTGVVRSAELLYCSAGCRDDHLALVALDGRTCEAAGCDRDRAADVPFCDEHLDPAAPAAPSEPLAGTRAA